MIDYTAVNKIECAVTTLYRLRAGSLSRRTREHRISHPPQVCMYLIRRLTRTTLAEIATLYKLDHTTVIYGIRRVERLDDARERSEIGGMEERLRADLDLHEAVERVKLATLMAG